MPSGHWRTLEPGKSDLRPGGYPALALTASGPTFQHSRPEASWRRRSLILIALVLVLGIAYGVSHGGHRSPTAPAAARQVARPARPTTLVAKVTGRLGSPVQDPATATDGSGSTLLIGGLSAADVSVGGIEATDGTSAHVAGTLPAPLHDAAATAIGGQVYFFGGGDTGSSDQILRVTPGSAPAAVGHLPAAASDVAAATIGTTAYIVGGYTGTTPLTTIVAWTPGAGARVVGRLPHPLRYAAVAAAGGKLVIAGGTSGVDATSDVYLFDPSSAAVRRIAVLPRPLTHAGAAALGSVVYVIGGRGSTLTSQTADVLAVDPASGSVRPAGRLPVALSDAGVGVAGGRIVVAGGRDPQGQVHSQILTLTPR